VPEVLLRTPNQPSTRKAVHHGPAAPAVANLPVLSSSHQLPYKGIVINRVKNPVRSVDGPGRSIYWSIVATHSRGRGRREYRPKDRVGFTVGGPFLNCGRRREGRPLRRESCDDGAAAAATYRRASVVFCCTAQVWYVPSMGPSDRGLDREDHGGDGGGWGARTTIGGEGGVAVKERKGRVRPGLQQVLALGAEEGGGGG